MLLFTEKKKQQRDQYETEENYYHSPYEGAVNSDFVDDLPQSISDEAEMIRIALERSKVQAMREEQERYCGIIIFRGGSIFVVFVDTINHEFTSPTNNDV